MRERERFKIYLVRVKRRLICELDLGNKPMEGCNLWGLRLGGWWYAIEKKNEKVKSAFRSRN